MPNLPWPGSFLKSWISVQTAQPYMEVEHDYPDKQVFLDIWQVDSFTGTARGKEGQQCRWVGLQERTTTSYLSFRRPISRFWSDCWKLE